MFDDCGFIDALRVAVIGALILTLTGGVLSGGSIPGL